MFESVLVGSSLVLVLLGGLVGFVLLFVVFAPAIIGGIYFLTRPLVRFFDERIPSRREEKRNAITNTHVLERQGFSNEQQIDKRAS